jgi:NADPH:quinone reductase-like Zn-dependent oxidoreductase
MASFLTAGRIAVNPRELIALGANHVIVSEEEVIESRVEQITGAKGVRIILDAVAGPLLLTQDELAATVDAGMAGDLVRAADDRHLVDETLH